MSQPFFRIFVYEASSVLTRLKDFLRFCSCGGIEYPGQRLHSLVECQKDAGAGTGHRPDRGSEARRIIVLSISPV